MKNRGDYIYIVRTHEGLILNFRTPKGLRIINSGQRWKFGKLIFRVGRDNPSEILHSEGRRGPVAVFDLNDYKQRQRFTNFVNSHLEGHKCRNASMGCLTRIKPGGGPEQPHNPSSHE